MSIIATAVKHLLAAGVTGEHLLAAIADLEVELSASASSRVDSAAERRREKDRVYQAARRAERRQNLPTSADSADNVDEADNTSLPLPPNENNSNPPTPTHPEETSGAGDADAHEGDPIDPQNLPSGGKPPKAKRPVAEPVPMPAGWEPVLTAKAQRIVDGWPPGMLDRELVAFEAHASTYDRETKDWQAAFRTWIVKAERQRIENGNRSTPAGRGFAPGHRPDHRDGFERALDRRIAAGATAN